MRSFEVGAKGAVGIVTFPQRPAELYRLADAVALSNHNRQLQKEIAWASVEGFDTERADGTRIGSMLLKPSGFQNGGPDPTVALIHDGPVGQDGFEFDAMAQAIAAQGYLVVNPNYRGSSGRGREFSRAIYADWGNLEIQDIHAVMDHLVAEGLADPDRLGIGGWSYGGMNTNYSIATDTRFRAGGERRIDLEHDYRLWNRPIRLAVRERARLAVEEHRDLFEDLLSLLPCGPHSDSNVVHVR